MNDFKKKIIDIIFEPDPTDPIDVKAEAPLTDIDDFKKAPKVEEPKETVKTFNAKDVLYNKQEKNFSFINYQETSKKEDLKKEKQETPVYEMRENVSPIFGLIAQKERKKRVASEKDIQKAITNSYGGEYTGIVLSPIYGYDVNKANDARKNLNNSLDLEDATTFDPSYKEAAFEIPEDMKETIKEAVEEAVIELTPKRENVNEQKNNVNETPVVEEDVYETPVEDYFYEEESLNDSKNEVQENEELIHEDNIEENIPTEKKNTKKATRSIYDTAPIQLFDFDELTGNDDNKDLFDELIGED